MEKFAFVLFVLAFLIAATVKNMDLGSEPVTMTLLGTVLVGLALFGRRMSFKKEQKSWEAGKHES